MKAQVRLQLTLPFKIRKQGRWFVASCPILDVVSQGRDAEAAKNSLREALVEFFLSCLERRTLDEVLRSAGFVPSAIGDDDEDAGDDAHSITVPLPFIVADALARSHADHPL